MTSEDEGVRLKWTAFLEFTQNQDVGDMTWDKVITEGTQPDDDNNNGALATFIASGGQVPRTILQLASNSTPAE